MVFAKFFRFPVPASIRKSILANEGKFVNSTSSLKIGSLRCAGWWGIISTQDVWKKPLATTASALSLPRAFGFNSQRDKKYACRKNGRHVLERLMGVEPTCQAWEACILPMNYSRINGTQSALQGQSVRCRYKNATANAEPAVQGFWEKSTCQKASAFFMVGVTGLEPMASWSRTKRDTKLRHTPKRTRFSTLWYYNIFHP